jgi:adenine specific DNA methylase Mod
MGTRFTNATETLLWCSKGENIKNYTFNYKLMKKYNGDKQMTSVWQIALCTGRERIKGEDGKKVHSTQKPEELLKRVILSSSRQGDIVLDPFFGTGTTGAVAKKLGRNYIGIEKEAEYIKVARARIESIKEKFPEAEWIEEEKKNQIKIPFEELIKENIIKSGEKLYTKKKYNSSALVLPDGNIKYQNKTGSIHKIGALIQESPSCNGWTFWYIAINDQVCLLDELRSNYIKKKYGI